MLECSLWLSLRHACRLNSGGGLLGKGAGSAALGRRHFDSLPGEGAKQHLEPLECGGHAARESPVQSAKLAGRRAAGHAGSWQNRGPEQHEAS